MYQLNFQPREYQKNIVETAKSKNTLVILPTGLGKTKIGIELAVERLNKYPESKILICTPTKPLSNQIKNEFIDSTNIDPSKIVLLTGLTKPEKREEIYKEAKVIVSTPQTSQKDLENNRLNLENFSLLILDEAHRSREKYANTRVSQNYFKKSPYPRILALTASPGSTKEKIDEIQKNLFIEAIEIRDETSEDVKPYLQEKNIEFIELDLPESFKEIHKIVERVYLEKVKQLKQFGLTKPSSLVNKRDIISFQSYLHLEIKNGNRSAFWAISLAAQALKLTHSLEMLETQSINSFYNFLKNLENETSKAAKTIINDKRVKNALNLTEKLIENKIEHPKLTKLRNIILNQLKENPNSKIIIFANFRDTVKNIAENLKQIENAHPVVLIGQKEGITQKKQLETLKEFEEGKYNIIVGTSISEEGLDIKGEGLSVAIFFDSVPSAVRRIQRAGRVGRLKAGKIIHLITKNTRDQAYHWKSHRDIKKMKNLISNIQSKLEKQSKLK